MQVTVPIYETPSRLSQGLVIGLSIAVVLMAGWFAATVMSSPEATTADDTASPIAAAPVSPTEATAAAPGSPTASRQTAQSNNAAQFDWPEEFNAAPAATPRTASTTALPLAPTELPVSRSPGSAPWPAAVSVPNAGDRSLPSRQPSPQASASTGTDAIVDLLSPAGAAREAAATIPPPRPVQPLRR